MMCSAAPPRFQRLCVRGAIDVPGRDGSDRQELVSRRACAGCGSAAREIRGVAVDFRPFQGCTASAGQERRTPDNRAVTAAPPGRLARRGSGGGV